MFSKVENELKMLKRHLEVLRLVLKEEPIGILKLADETGLPKHKVRYSLRVLEHKGLIKPSQQGAVTTRKAKQFINDFYKKIESLEKEIEEIKTMKLKE
ncbi:MAG: hypothetical protein QXJ68_00655 [Methanocellales archaeon]